MAEPIRDRQRRFGVGYTEGAGCPPATDDMAKVIALLKP
jgi:hypothetical protein